VTETRNDRVKQRGNVPAANVAPRHVTPRPILIRHGASLADVRYWYG
jgi:hypothetical protein